MKLTDKQKNLLALYRRSPRDTEGWANVSKAVWKLVAGEDADLFEIKQTPEGPSHGVIRPTNKGMTLLEYVI